MGERAGLGAAAAVEASRFRRFIEGRREMSADEAGGRLGNTAGAVRIRVHRDRTELRDRLGGPDG